MSAGGAAGAAAGPQRSGPVPGCLHAGAVPPGGAVVRVPPRCSSCGRPASSPRAPMRLAACSPTPALPHALSCTPATSPCPPPCRTSGGRSSQTGASTQVGGQAGTRGRRGASRLPGAAWAELAGQSIPAGSWAGLAHPPLACASPFFPAIHRPRGRPPPPCLVVLCFTCSQPDADVLGHTRGGGAARHPVERRRPKPAAGKPWGALLPRAHPKHENVPLLPCCEHKGCGPEGAAHRDPSSGPLSLQMALPGGVEVRRAGRCSRPDRRRVQNGQRLAGAEWPRAPCPCARAVPPLLHPPAHSAPLRFNPARRPCSSRCPPA